MHRSVLSNLLVAIILSAGLLAIGACFKSSESASGDISEDKTGSGSGDSGTVKESKKARFVMPDKSKHPWKVTELGYVESQDAFVETDNGVYAFVVFSRENMESDKKELIIRSNLLTGTSWTPEKGSKMASDLQRKGKNMRLWGDPFKAAGDKDKRRIEYRFYQQDGKPEKIEVFVVTRNKDYGANDPKILEVPWPFK